MGNNIASTYTPPDDSYGDLYVQGRSSTRQFIVRLFEWAGISGGQRARTVASRLNLMFSNPTKYWFEFCTPGMITYPTYSVIIVPNVVRAIASPTTTPPSSWYSTTKELIMDITPNDAAAPWYVALLAAMRIRNEVLDDYGATYNPKPLYEPEGTGQTDTTYLWRGMGSTYYGAGTSEKLGGYVANNEIFHPCDLTIATRVRYTESGFITTFNQKGSEWVRVYNPANGRVVVCRQNDWGPGDYDYQQNCGSIDLTYGGSKQALDVTTGDCSMTTGLLDFRYLQ